MLASIVRFSLTRRGVVLVLAACLCIYGCFTIRTLPVDVFPNFAPPQLTIQTEAPGFSPVQVEQLVTEPLEALLSGTPAVRDLNSKSFQGLSVIHLVFVGGTDIYRARQETSERLVAARGTLPRQVHAPTIAPLTSPAQVVRVIGLTSRVRSLRDVRTFADWTVRRSLLAVPGVASVTVFGGYQEELQIQPNLAALRAQGMTLGGLTSAVRGITRIDGAGFADTPNQRVLLQVEGSPSTPAELGRVVIRMDGDHPVLLRDVATVKRGSAPPLGAASVDGKPGVQLMVDNQLGSNTLQVTRGLDVALDDLAPALASAHIRLHRNVFLPARFISVSVHNVKTALWLGGALVAIVLLLFTLEPRMSLCSLVAIPLSLIAAILVLSACGATVNTMTLGGLAIAIGEVVDDAVIDVENIFRRLDENRTRIEAARSEGVDPAKKGVRSTFDVIFDASMEVRGAVVYATFAVLAVFIPVLTLSGLVGRLLAPLAQAYIAAVLASLAVALTVTPALAYAGVARREAVYRPSGLMRRLMAVYERVAGAAVRHAGVVIGLVGVLTVAAVAYLPFIGTSLLPDLQEGHVILHMTLLPGSSLQESMALGKSVSRLLLADPDVLSVAQRAGRAQMSDDPHLPEQSEFDVELSTKDGRSEALIAHDILTRLEVIPGAMFAVKPFLSERIDESMSGFSGSVVVSIFGARLRVLDGVAEQVQALMGKMRGATNVTLRSMLPRPRLVCALDARRLIANGLTPTEVTDQVQTAWQGTRVGQVYRGDRTLNVRVILPSAERKDPERIGDLWVGAPGRAPVRLSSVAHISWAPSRTVILHDGGRRLQALTCDVAGRAVSSFVRELKRRLAAMHLPAGVYASVGGEAVAHERAIRELEGRCALALVAVGLLLTMALGSTRSVVLVMLNVPFALVGGVLAVAMQGSVLTLGSTIGFVTLFGITMRNAIMLITHYQHLVEVEGEPWTVATVIRGARERLGPILMTALVTGLGLLPMALGSGTAGREIDGPMATVILGGLFTSTALTLLVLPAIAWRHGRMGDTR